MKAAADHCGSRTRRGLFLALLLVAGVTGLAEWRFAAPQRAALAASHAEFARTEKELQAARQRLAATNRERDMEARKLQAARAELAAAEADPAKLWALRISLLKQLLAELPSQRIPEIKLLGPLDWIAIARRADLESANKIRAVLATVRGVARQKFATQLQEALRRFTTDSHGELPADIRQLAPLLTPPADTEMLDRYTMLRTGKVGDESEHVIKEKPGADAQLSVALQGWHMGTAFEGEFPKLDEGEFTAWSHLAGVLGAATGSSLGVEPAEAKEFMGNLARGIGTMMDGIKANELPNFETVFAQDPALGNEIKAAAKQFVTTHPNQELKDFSQVAPYLNEQRLERFAEELRPMFARLQYLVEHQFKPPANLTDLQPYLANLTAKEALRGMTLTFDGEHISVGYNFSTEDVK